MKSIIAGDREDHWHINWDVIKAERNRDEI